MPLGTICSLKGFPCPTSQNYIVTYIRTSNYHQNEYTSARSSSSHRDILAGGCVTRYCSRSPHSPTAACMWCKTLDVTTSSLTQVCLRRCVSRSETFSFSFLFLANLFFVVMFGQLSAIFLFFSSLLRSFVLPRISGCGFCSLSFPKFRCSLRVILSF